MTRKPTYEELAKRVKYLEGELAEGEHFEETFRDAFSMFRDILEKAADGICVCHNICEEPYVKFTHWNLRMTVITGYTMEDINEQGWYQTMYPDPEVQKRAVERMVKMREGDDILAEEWVITTKSGEKKTLSISTSVVKEEDGTFHVLAVMQDITERKNDEETLRESEERFRFLAEKMADIVWILDRDFQTTYVSPSIEKILGFTPEERKRQKLEEMITPESLKSVQMMFLEELRRDETGNADPDRSVTIEVEYYHKDGSTVWMENNVKAMRDHSGAIDGMYGVSRDITERKKAQEALRESSERMESILFSLPTGIMIIDKETQEIVDANPQAILMTEAPLEQLVGSKYNKFIYLADGDKSAISDTGRAPIDSECVLLTSKSEKISIYASTIPVTLNNRECLILSFNDISEHKRAEYERIQKEKLQGVIEMAGAVCHELNQPLQAVSGYSELLMMDVKGSNPLYDKLSKIKKQIDRMGNITQKFMKITKYETKDYLKGKIIDIDKAAK